MSIYLSNYWSLYSDFINLLKDVKYREIPIALMTNFYQQINDDLKKEMEHPDFATRLNDASINELSQIQPFFEQILSPLKKPLKRQPNGKILINQDYTRIPVNVLQEHFSPKHTIILSRSKNTDIHGIPNEFNGQFKKETNKISEQLISEVRFIFEKQEDHPALSHSFFVNTFLQRISMIVETLELVFNLFDQRHIATVLIGTTEDIGSRALAVIASMRGIPCICLQHGLLIGEEAFIPMFASYAAVYGEYEKRWYLARGLEAERVKAIGHPKFDEIFHSSRLPKNVFLKKYQLDPNKITLLIATGPYLDRLKFTTMISELVKNKNYQILIKPHPWEIGKNKIDLYREIGSKSKSVHIITDRKVNTHDLIFHSDGVLTTLSTVGLESLLFNKPVFIYYFIEHNRYYDYYDRLSKFMNHDPLELTKVISLYFNSQIKTEYENIKNQFLLDSYASKTSGKELSNLIFQLSGVRTKQLEFEQKSPSY
ncbi:CDP-glycerol glycerophosphotransferase family protein [Lederbergia sp. NSJ-179]|uniref:capsular polysaccharide export protein, LipB/KpsS family n=1 Tax=Lederbergia sp. NSJ-179 TaxID=2931402 RepID=UPI001FD40D67|nr:CDP-glycerol glycerophosphotransferase family protein [Lederbergia sp. NSJ-179]MCJ7841352.1 CDP-glycerol glycerophosphotransferase family protein [Lederbergia sp. NSJ-179]